MVTQFTFTYDDIRSILVDHLDVDPDKLVGEANPNFDELGLDSLAGAELQVVLHEKYGIDIPDEQAHAMRTVLELVECMNMHAASGATALEGGPIVRSPLEIGGGEEQRR